MLYLPFMPATLRLVTAYVALPRGVRRKAKTKPYTSGVEFSCWAIFFSQRRATASLTVTGKPEKPGISLLFKASQHFPPVFRYGFRVAVLPGFLPAQPGLHDPMLLHPVT